jgi:hypothetical protein
MYYLNLPDKKQSGSVLIFSLLLMSSILAVSLTMASLILPKIKTVRDASINSTFAFYTTDTIMEWCLYENRKTVEPQPTLNIGATFTTSGNCSILPLNYRVVGSYNGVSRSLEATTP